MANEIEVRLVLDDGTYKKGLIKAEDIAKVQGKKIGESLEGGIEKRLTSSFISLKKNLLGFGAAFAGAFAFKEVISATLKQEMAVQKLNQSLMNAGTFSRQTSKDFQDLAAELQNITGIGDEVILDLAGLARQMAKTDDQAKQMVRAALDLSAATGISLESAVKNLGKTLSGLTGELGESVPELRNLTQAQLKNGEAIDLVARKYEGFAKAQGDTTAGAMAKVSSSFSDFLEKIGAIITTSPAFINILNGIAGGLQAINRLLGNDTNKAFDATEQKIVTAFEKASIAVFDARSEVEKIQKSLKDAESSFSLSDPFAAKRLRASLNQAENTLQVALQNETALQAQFDEILKKRERAAGMRSGGVAGGGLTPQEVSQQLSFQQALSQATSSRIDAEVKNLSLISNVYDLREARLRLHEERKQQIENEFESKAAGLRQQYNDRRIVSQQQLNLLLEQLELEKNLKLDAHQKQFADTTQVNMDSVVMATKTAFAQMTVSAQQVGQVFAQTFVTGMSSAFAAFGGALQKGKNAFEAFGDSVFQTIGGLAIQLGQFFILVGTGMTATASFLGLSGGAAIAAGIGLTVFGGFLQSLGGGGGESAGGGGAVGGGGAGGGPSDVALPEVEDIQERGPEITVNIEGNVLDRRETGLEIVSIINEAFEQQGAVVRTA